MALFFLIDEYYTLIIPASLKLNSELVNANNWRGGNKTLSICRVYGSKSV